MNTFMPWFVTFAVCVISGMVFWSYATFLPVTPFALFLMALMSISGIIIICCFFRIYAIFERMDKRERKWKEQMREWNK